MPCPRCPINKALTPRTRIKIVVVDVVSAAPRRDADAEINILDYVVVHLYIEGLHDGNAAVPNVVNVVVFFFFPPARTRDTKKGTKSKTKKGTKNKET